MLRTEQAGKLQHHPGGRAAVVGADKVGEALGVVVRAEENDAGFFAGDLHQNVFHGDASGGVSEPKESVSTAQP